MKAFGFCHIARSRGQSSIFLFKAHSCIGPVSFPNLNAVSLNCNSIFDNLSPKTGNQAQIGYSFGWIEVNKMDGTQDSRNFKPRENGLN